MKPNVIAHRGASYYAPENTMAAFKLAKSLGAEGIEVDVHLTKDNVPIIMHDEKVNRTTDNSGFIKDYTYSQIKAFDAGSWFSKEYTNEKIPSLEEFLLWIKPTQLIINIELKNNKIDYVNLESIVYKLLNTHNLLHRTIFSTFNKKSIIHLRNIDSSLEVAWLTSKKRKDLITYASKIKANALHIDFRLLNKKIIEQARKKNMPIRVYTVNSKKQYLKCFSLQCDSIFTDIPDLARKNKHSILKGGLHNGKTILRSKF